MLVVDDDMGVREVIADALQLDGFEVVPVEGGHEALLALDAGLRPSIVLLDLLMPGMSGERLLPLLRTNPATRGVPVVIMSASPERLAHIEGADARLAKPFDLDDLLELIARLRGPERARAVVLGIPSVDSEHQAQLDLAAALAEAVRGARPVHEAGKILGELLDCTRSHFQQEANLMQSRGYPFMALHQREHSRQLLELEQRRDAARTQASSLTPEDAVALRAMLEAHIETFDRDMARYLETTSCDEEG